MEVYSCGNKQLGGWHFEVWTKTGEAGCLSGIYLHCIFFSAPLSLRCFEPWHCKNALLRVCWPIFLHKSQLVTKAPNGFFLQRWQKQRGWGDEWRRWWEKGTGDKKGILLKSKTMAWLTTGRRPDNWRQSITVVNSQVEGGQKDRGAARGREKCWQEHSEHNSLGAGQV